MRITDVSSLLFLLLTAVLSSRLFGRDTLTPSQPLADDGTTLISAGSNFRLGFFSPNGYTDRYVGIWYDKVPVQTVVWVANREQPLTDRSGRLSITINGTLRITDDNSTVFWTSASPALAGAVVARLLDTGNFVVTAGDDGGSDTFAWESFRFPTDSLLPGLKVGYLKSGQVVNLTSWRSTSDPSPGDYVASCDLHGDPQLFIWFGSQKYYRGGSWNGVSLSGMPDMKYSEMVQYEALASPDQVVFYFISTNPSIISRFVLTPLGTLQHVGWIEGAKSWKIFGYSPKDQCDPISQCGPNGVCYALREMMCTCMPGFRPRNSTKWDGKDWSDGCTRKTQLDCHNGTDGFVMQTNLKLPDTSTSVVDMSMNLEQCRALCLANCSCTAYANANISGSGSGCIIWTSDLTDVRSYDNDLGQDLYLRLAAADLGGTGSKHSHRLRLIILVSIILTICLLAFATYLMWKKNETNRYRADVEKEVKDMDLPLFDLNTIVDATGNFSADNKLGQGGFGPVYKGKVGEGQEIAIKRLSKTSAQGVDEFKNEVVLIAKLQHRNLIRLLGCCVQGGERMLIYEYMPNGSLDAFLFDEAKRVLLDWPTRYNIIVGIAQGLLYLHQYSRFRIIHRDLKASNILLDNEMNPKISDFGLARIFGGEDSEINTRKVVGTYGYMSPEYAMDGIFSVKSDVFSFGVLVLEIITSIKNRGVYHRAPHLNLLGHVWSLWKEGKALELIDRSIEYSMSMPNVFSCIKVGLLCVQEQPKDRPNMSTVVKMLGNEAAFLPEPMQPGFVATKGPSVQMDPSANKEFLSKNSISMTMLDGR